MRTRIAVVINKETMETNNNSTPSSNLNLQINLPNIYNKIATPIQLKSKINDLVIFIGLILSYIIIPKLLDFYIESNK